MDSSAQIDGGSAKRNYIIPFKIIGYRQKLFLKPQNHHKSTPIPNSAIIPNSFDIKNMPDLTAHSKPSPNHEIQFKDYKQYSKNGDLGVHPRKLGAP